MYDVEEEVVGTISAWSVIIIGADACAIADDCACGWCS